MSLPAYPITYQPETSPSWLNYTAALSGAATCDLKRPFRYLELGCGRGYSALLHSAAHPGGDFHAVDRDTGAIAAARAWADACGVRNVTFHAAPFAQTALEGRFDFIVLHGVYSWVDAAARARVRVLLRDLLAPGGLGYVSYNCLPGWAGELPLRRLLNEFSMGGDADAAARELERLRACGFAYFKAHPSAERAVRSWAGRPEGYLAQEYLADACEVLWAVDVMDEMAAVGLTWIASATPRDHHEALLVDEEASRAIAGLGTARLRTLALDFAVNRSFRRDVFVRGEPVRDSVALGAVKIRLCGDAIPLSIVMPRGRIHFGADFIAALQKIMAGGAIGLDQAVAALGEPRAARNILWLIAGGALAPAMPDEKAFMGLQARLSRIGIAPS